MKTKIYIKYLPILISICFLIAENQHTDFRGEFKRFHISEDNLPPTSNSRDTNIWAYVCDSYGDGWNGNTLIIGGWSSQGPPSGSDCEWQEIGELADGNYAVICGGGSWQSEVSWIITDQEANQLLSGGAPYEGNLCVGDCEGGNEDLCWEFNELTGGYEWMDCDGGGFDIDIPGCMDENACNYNEDAEVDDATCYYAEDNYDCEGNYIEPSVDYLSQIQPIFDNNCGNCHLGNSSAGLNLSNYNNLMSGGNSGDVVLPHNSAESILIQKLGANPPSGGAQMPRNSDPLDDDLIALIALWIDQGANNSVICEDYMACNYEAESDCIYPQENYDCDGNCLIEIDCLGECGGFAEVDECGICEGNGASYVCWDNSLVCNSYNCPEDPSDDSQHYTLNDTGQSSQVILDVINPTISIIAPNGGDIYDSGETVLIDISYTEDYLADTPIDVYFSEGLGSDYINIADNLLIDSLSITLPDINTNDATIKVVISDYFGNSDDDISDAFTIGNPEDDIIIEHYTLNDTGQSTLTLVDVMLPTITLIYPNGNEEFEGGEVIEIEWEYEEPYLSEAPFEIFLSESTGSEFYLIETGIPISNATQVSLPDIDVNGARFKITITDYFGNYSEDFSDGGFSIGESSQMEDFEQYILNDMGQSEQTTMDVVDPEITVEYPNGGELVDNYDDCYVSCPSYDDHLTNGELTVEISFALGGWFMTAADNIDPYYSYDYNIDLSSDGEIPESIYGLMRATVTDDFGNTSTDMSNGYFILGEPDGDINLNYINEEEKSVLVDWSWIENQVISITDEAIASISNYDYIKIYDEQGINTDYCSEEDGTVTTGLVELVTIDISEEIGSKTVSLPCGFDYCSLGGSRIVGYYPENTIKFSVGVNGEDEQHEILPATSQLIDEDMTFNNETFIINSFTIGDRINTTGALSIDEREWDEFNVYGKVTNHQGSANRSCNDDGICDAGESLVDCFDDCCPEAGTGENDEWCLLETLEGVSTFQDNLISGNYVPYVPAGTSSATFNYRVWLLDNNGAEVVKTIDTEINYESDDLIAYHNDLLSGWNWISLNIENSESMSINNLFSNSELSNSDYIKSQTGSSTYYSSGGVWYPDWNMDLKSLYLLDLSEETSILYQGNYSYPSEIEIPIATGWNWISYTPTTSSDINTALALFTPSNQDYIKSQTSSSTYYSSGGVWYPDITLQPTKGYMLSASIEQSLFYPDIESSPSENNLLLRENYEPEFNYREYEFNASATLELDMPHLEVTNNDRIEVFYNNELRGVAQGDICPLNDKILFNLMIYSNNQSDENLTLAYTNSITGKEYTMRETLDFEKDTILGNAYNPILLTDAALPYQTELLAPYPNPFNPRTTIDFSLTDDYDNLLLNVYDIRGRLVETIYSGFMPYGYHSITWNASNFSSGIYFVNMITKENRFIKKITLLK